MSISRPRNSKNAPAFNRQCRSNSSLAPSRFADDSLATDLESRKGEDFRPLSDTKNGTPWSADLIQPKEIYTAEADGRGSDSIDQVIQSARHEANRVYKDARNLEVTLEDLLADQEGHHFHDVWHAYCSINSGRQTGFQARVVAYLARSQSIVETGRAMSLLHLVEPKEWTEDFLSAAVLLFLRSRDYEKAIEFFKRGVQERGLVGGFEYLLLDAVNRQQWSGILDAWEFYYEHSSTQIVWGDRLYNERLLQALGSLPNLGALYFSLERFLSTDSERRTRISTALLTARAIKVFRREFALQALRQGCPPRQASVILDFWREPRYYDKYFGVMFDKWYNKAISDSTARELLPIYDDFRTTPGAKLKHSVLKGIFQILYPARKESLERLYDDWIAYCGELSHWAFDKYMKFYAEQGDAARVRQLWDRCAEVYPGSVERPAGFRSTLNVYAQNADVKGAEEEFRRMTEVYKIKPDLTSWNILLKCYSRADDDAKTREIFDKICESQQPDSYTFAHVMAMTSKKGDLDGTLKYLEEAQKRLVPMTREMTLGLVVAYCKNGRLSEAETICFELAEHGLVSTAAWKDLITLRGRRGQLKKCYALLNKMEEFGLEWDSDIISALLKALVQVKQVYPAYDVLRDHAESRSDLLHPDHFDIVLGGAVKTNNRHIMESVMFLAEKARIPVSFNMLVTYTQGIMRTAPTTLRDNRVGEQIPALLDTLHANPRNAYRKRTDVSRIGQAVRVLSQLQDYTAIEKLLTTYENMFPGRKAVSRDDITAALIMAYLRDGQWDQAHLLWFRAWPHILKRCSRPDGKGVYPAYEYHVTAMVYQMTRAFVAQRNGNGLAKLVDMVTEAGFKLTSNTWDLIIRQLARLGEWERAMDYCETWLMPNWEGWGSRKMPHWKDKNPDKNERRLEQRQERTDNRVLRPTPEALATLEAQWLKARKMAAWSEDIAQKLDKMELTHPKLRNAFKTARWSDGWGPYVFNAGRDLPQVMVSRLAPLSIGELRRLRDVLETHLQKQPDEPLDMFQLLRKNSDQAKPLRFSELQLLRRVLSKSLSEKTGSPSPIRHSTSPFSRRVLGRRTKAKSRDETKPQDEAASA